MFHLLSNKDSQKPTKFHFIEGQFINSRKHGIATQDFENGCTFIGNYIDDEIHGKGKFSFPEGSVIEGFFENNHFRKGLVHLSVGVAIQGITATDPETLEDYFKDFSIKFKSGYIMKGNTNDKGSIENAVIFNPGNEIVAKYKSGNLVYKLPDHTGQYIVISKLWAYEGGLNNYTSENASSLVFDNDGVQIWFTGIGYYKGFRQNGVQDKQQLILRHSGSLQFFREITYNQGRLFNSITVYNSGIIFISNDDYFKGSLKFFLLNGEEIELKCNLTEYSVLKSGSVTLDDEDSPVKFSLKNGRLIFSYRNKDLTLDEFKESVLLEK